MVRNVQMTSKKLENHVFTRKEARTEVAYLLVLSNDEFFHHSFSSIFIEKKTFLVTFSFFI